MAAAFCWPLQLNIQLADSTVPVLDPASPNAAAIYHLFFVVSLICLAIFVIVATLICMSVVRFRASGGELPAQNFGSDRSEIIWTIFPVVIVLFLAVMSAKLVLSAQASASVDVAGPGNADLIVVGHQWWWEARYPGSGVVAANEIHVPIGHKFLVRVDSADVIHSFWVPQLAPKMDMVPGQHNYVYLQADQPGVYDGACSEFCGDQHAWMRFIVVAQSESEYAQWLASQALPGRVPSAPYALAGRKIFFTQTCINCHAIGGTSAIANAAPDLTHISLRRQLAAGVIPNTPDNLARWLRNPQDIKPGCKMPDFGLDDNQVNQLVAYLEGL
ncbi:MAG: cytochrome c oxidase subunit II [Tepidisphaeraceae bacterium]|jgi:cytochrome c oxidase subunit 2